MPVCFAFGLVNGVTITLDPPSERLRYQAPDGTASVSLRSTSPPFAHALAFNSSGGPTRIVAKKDGVVAADQVVEVVSGSSYTVSTVRAAGP